MRASPACVSTSHCTRLANASCQLGVRTSTGVLGSDAAGAAAALVAPADAPAGGSQSPCAKLDVSAHGRERSREPEFVETT